MTDNKNDFLNEIEDYDLETFLTEEEKNEDEETTNPNPEEDIDFDKGEEDEELSLSDIGKVYMLKNIYTTLNNLYQFADSIIEKYGINQDIIKIQEVIQELKDLYLLIAFNITKYLDKLDTIITLLVKAVEIIANQLKDLEEKLDGTKNNTQNATK